MHVAASVTKSDNDQLQPIEQPSVATSRSTTLVYGSASVLAACTSYDGFMQISYFTSKAQWSLYVPHSGHYVPHSGHYMYRTVVTTCTAQWSLHVLHSGHYVYRTVVTICTTSLTINNSTFCPHSCIYVFCVDLRTNSDYFLIQH